MTASSEYNAGAAPSGIEASATPRRLYRSRTNRTLAGVCGGIAEYYLADPGAVRLLAVVIAVFTGIVPMLVVYLVAAIVIPERIDGPAGTEPNAAGPSVGRGQGGLVFGGLLVVVGLVALANELFRVDWDLLWPIAFVVLGGMVLLATQRR